jgi:hypothetical protein
MGRVGTQHFVLWQNNDWHTVYSSNFMSRNGSLCDLATVLVLLLLIDAAAVLVAGLHGFLARTSTITAISHCENGSSLGRMMVGDRKQRQLQGGGIAAQVETQQDKSWPTLARRHSVRVGTHALGPSHWRMLTAGCRLCWYGPPVHLQRLASNVCPGGLPAA